MGDNNHRLMHHPEPVSVLRSDIIDRYDAQARVIATVGLHGSGSTWVYNIVRELVIAVAGEPAMIGIYADAMEELPSQQDLADKWIVVKSHHGSQHMDTWLQSAKAQYVLSVRDPRDAVISMQQRFNVPLVWAVHMVMNDCHRLCSLIAQGHLVLRYEDRFFEHPEAIDRIATKLGLSVGENLIIALSHRYSAGTIRSFVDALPSLPSQRLGIAGTNGKLFDKVTQLHQNHIGDTCSGKWIDLPDPIKRQMTSMLSPFLNRLGY
jgi:hypothetical protein